MSFLAATFLYFMAFFMACVGSWALINESGCVGIIANIVFWFWAGVLVYVADYIRRECD